MSAKPEPQAGYRYAGLMSQSSLVGAVAALGDGTMMIGQSVSGCTFVAGGDPSKWSAGRAFSPLGDLRWRTDANVEDMVQVMLLTEKDAAWFTTCVAPELLETSYRLGRVLDGNRGILLWGTAADGLGGIRETRISRRLEYPGALPKDTEPPHITALQYLDPHSRAIVWLRFLSLNSSKGSTAS